MLHLSLKPSLVPESMAVIVSLRSLARRLINSLEFRFWRFADRKLWRFYGWILEVEIRRRLGRVAPRDKEQGAKRILITTYSNHAIPAKVVAMQEAVVTTLIRDHNEYVWLPIRSCTRAMHYLFIDHMLAHAFRWVDFVILLDVDCVPYSVESFNYLVHKASEGFLVGVEQVSPGHGGKHYYISPVASCIGKDIYMQLGRPSAIQDLHGDVMESFTFSAEKLGVPVDYIRVSSVEVEPRWRFPDGRSFGIGTVYSIDGRTAFFHNFCSSSKQTKREFSRRSAGYLDKFYGTCRSILAGDLPAPLRDHV